MEKEFFIGVVIYLIIISIIGIIMTVKDKTAAIIGKRRISENTLMTLGLLGGAFLMFVTMNIIRHKTKHMKFMFGLPLFAAIHIGIIAYVYSVLNNLI